MKWRQDDSVWTAGRTVVMGLSVCCTEHNLEGRKGRLIDRANVQNFKMMRRHSDDKVVEGNTPCKVNVETDRVAEDRIGRGGHRTRTSILVWYPNEMPPSSRPEHIVKICAIQGIFEKDQMIEYIQGISRRCCPNHRLTPQDIQLTLAQ